MRRCFESQLMKAGALTQAVPCPNCVSHRSDRFPSLLSKPVLSLRKDGAKTHRVTLGSGLWDRNRPVLSRDSALLCKLKLAGTLETAQGVAGNVGFKTHWDATWDGRTASVRAGRANLASDLYKRRMICVARRHFDGRQPHGEKK